MRLSRKGLILIVGGSVFLVSSIVGVEVTSQSWFCGSACHIMEPYYTSWKESTHSGVKCVECHIPPGASNFIEAKLNGAGQVVDDVLDRTSTKPSASVEDFACQRSGCHGPAAGGNLDPNGERHYRFTHEKHLHLEYKGIKIQCTTCHSHVQGDEHFVVNTNVCVTCHLVTRAPDTTVARSSPLPMHSVAFTVRRSLDVDAEEAAAEIEGGESGERALVSPSDCQACHDPPDQPIKHLGRVIDHREYLQYGTRCDSCHRTATADPDSVKDAQCLGCHAFGLEKTPMDAVEMHRVHAEGKHKVECFTCHGVTRHGVIADAQRLRQLDCENCHSGQHDVQVTTFASEERAGVDKAASMVSPMFLSHVDCNACHVEPRPLDPETELGGSFLAAVPSACDSCHKEGTGQQMVTMWQNDTRKLFKETMDLLEAFDEKASSPEAQRLREEARRLLDLVKLDGSWGVHNPRYTARLLELARRNLVEARRVATEEASRERAER